MSTGSHWINLLFFLFIQQNCVANIGGGQILPVQQRAVCPVHTALHNNWMTRSWWLGTVAAFQSLQSLCARHKGSAWQLTAAIKKCCWYWEKKSRENEEVKEAMHGMLQRRYNAGPLGVEECTASFIVAYLQYVRFLTVVCFYTVYCSNSILHNNRETGKSLEIGECQVWEEVLCLSVCVCI